MQGPSLIKSLARIATADAVNIGRQLHEELLLHLSAAWRVGLPKDELLERAEQIVSGFGDQLAKNLSEALFGSFLTGAGEVAGSAEGLLPPPGVAAATAIPHAGPATSPAPALDEICGFNPIVDNAVRILRSKRPMTSTEFQQASDKARVLGFTLAGEHTTGTVEKVRDSLALSLENGDGYGGFKRRLRGELDTSPTGAGSLENVYRTGIARARTEGMDKVLENPIIGSAFPYVENQAIWDSNLTELCEAVTKNGINGTAIFRRDDVFWIKFKCPRHWRCRCNPRYLTVEQAAKKGVPEAKIWHATQRPPTIPTFVPWITGLELPRGWVSP